jgi:hypothetical protein
MSGEVVRKNICAIFKLCDSVDLGAEIRHCAKLKIVNVNH